jgi:hypothetical protein
MDSTGSGADDCYSRHGEIAISFRSTKFAQDTISCVLKATPTTNLRASDIVLIVKLHLGFLLALQKQCVSGQEIVPIR